VQTAQPARIRPTFRLMPSHRMGSLAQGSENSAEIDLREHSWGDIARADLPDVCFADYVRIQETGHTPSARTP